MRLLAIVMPIGTSEKLRRLAIVSGVNGNLRYRLKSFAVGLSNLEISFVNGNVRYRFSSFDFYSS